MSIPVTVVGRRALSGIRPKVSVAMITYNHEKFIEQAVESVMMQRTRFPYELVISEDCSKDRTRDILVDLQRKYEDRIRLRLPERNVGVVANSIQTIQSCEGNYIAVIEGDDFWTNADKLQRQVDQLDNNAEFSASFTRSRAFYEGPSPHEHLVPSGKMDRLTFDTIDLLRKNYIAAASVMYRDFVKDIDFEPLRCLAMTDWPLHVLVSLRGPIGFIPEVMAAYRLHSGGVWSGTATIPKLRSMVKARETVATLLPARFASHAVVGTIRICHTLAAELLREGNRSAARTWAWKSLGALMCKGCWSQKWLLKKSVLLLMNTFRGSVRWSGGA